MCTTFFSRFSHTRVKQHTSMLPPVVRYRRIGATNGIHLWGVGATLFWTVYYHPASQTRTLYSRSTHPRTFTQIAPTHQRCRKFIASSQPNLYTSKCDASINGYRRHFHSSKAVSSQNSPASGSVAEIKARKTKAEMFASLAEENQELGGGCSPILRFLYIGWNHHRVFCTSCLGH